MVLADAVSEADGHGPPRSRARGFATPLLSSRPGPALTIIPLETAVCALSRRAFPPLPAAPRK